MKSSPIQTSFNAGELSPLLDGRVDFNKYPNGASIMENLIPTVQGPIRRRGGTRFVHEVKDSTKRVFLQEFQFSVTQAYILEFGDQYIRFYTWDTTTLVRGIVEVAPGVPLEVATPYTLADIFASDGTCRLRFAQSADVLYITHPSYPPQELRRTSPTSFSFARFENRGGPWRNLDTTGITVYASGETGAVTLTASQPIWSVLQVGSTFYLENQLVDSVFAWEVGQTVAIGNRRRSDGKNYEAATAGTTGTNRPVHTEGTLFDGAAVSWTFRDPGYGYVIITGFNSPTSVNATVVDRLPAQVVGSGNATTRWSHSAWGPVGFGGVNTPYPSDVVFHRERLWFASGQNIWSSVSSDFNDFHPLNFGQVTDDMAISLTIQTGSINAIQWMVSEKELLVGTAGAESTLGELQNGDPLGPGNIRIKVQSRFGSKSIVPIVLGASTLFVQRSGLKAREIFYDFGSDGYRSTDTTVLSEHITQTGLVDLALAQEPDPIVWFCREDGALIGFTWNNEQEVRAWHRHPIGGDGIVESVATMPAAEGDRDELWLSVRRTINGVTKRYVEYMERPRRPGDPQNSQFYVDSGLTYDGVPADTISGLDHLEGATVNVLADGAPHPNRVVTGGQIELQAEYSVVQIGLPCPCKWRSMRIEAGAQDGTAQGKTKRLHKVVMRFFETAGGKFGANVDNLDWIQYRDPADPMNQPVPLFSGDKVLQWNHGYDTDGYVMYFNDQPMQATLIAVMPQVRTYDDR